MPQIILKERAAHLGSYTFFIRDVDQYKNMSLSQLYQPPRTAFSQNTYYWLLSSCEYCKVFRNSFFHKHLQKQSFADVSQNRYSYKFCKLHRKALVLESLFKKLKAFGLHLHKIRLQHRCFPVKFAKFLRTPFLTEHLQWLLLHLRCLLLYFSKKVLFNSYFATLLWRTNIFFFLNHRLMYKKWNSFVYKFVTNCQVF